MTRPARSTVAEERAMQMYPVYARGAVNGARPRFWVNAIERREMINAGSAKPISHGKAIQLLLNLETFRGTSATMGPNVTLRAVGLDGSYACMKFNQAIVEAWA